MADEGEKKRTKEKKWISQVNKAELHCCLTCSSKVKSLLKNPPERSAN